MLMLDSDIVIDVQRGHPDAVAWFRGLTELPLLPGLVMMELIQDAPNKKQMEAVQRLVKPLPIVWPSTIDCDKALDDFTVICFNGSGTNRGQMFETVSSSGNGNIG
jgi:predicted nucleic acid-binding protein